MLTMMISDDGDETGCQVSCSPDTALRDSMESQQSSIDTMQEQITRMRDLIRSMTSGRPIATAAAASDTVCC